ncbi:MAG: hypothetical protein JW745_09680 [Sedimentisphaerales bacterium]|nr:hypothetical protein [Sedimentisphaerales bacterium]MBN2842156.1 hypothetical protein [Sedimentisphaerales bacterium]
MDITMPVTMGQMGLGLALGLGAVGSALGIGVAGQAAAGAWAKEAKAGKPLSFQYIILAGMPLSQTFYALILALVFMKGKAFGAEGVEPIIASFPGAFFGIGLAGGLIELFSAWYQGKIGAAACRALCEGEGKGFVFMIIAMGLVESVGLLGFIFLFLLLP